MYIASFPGGRNYWGVRLLNNTGRRSKVCRVVNFDNRTKGRPTTRLPSAKKKMHRYDAIFAPIHVRVILPVTKKDDRVIRLQCHHSESL